MLNIIIPLVQYLKAWAAGAGWEINAKFVVWAPSELSPGWSPARSPSAGFSKRPLLADPLHCTGLSPERAQPRRRWSAGGAGAG